MSQCPTKYTYSILAEPPLTRSALSTRGVTGWSPPDALRHSGTEGGERTPSRWAAVSDAWALSHLRWPRLRDAIQLRAWVVLGRRRLRRVPPGLPRHGGRENGEIQEPDERASGDFHHTQHGAPVIHARRKCRVARRMNHLPGWDR